MVIKPSNMKRGQRKFDWIFFDFDGTLVDSISASYKAHIDFLAKFGIKTNKDEFEELNGPSIPDIITILIKKYNLIADKNYLIDLYRKEILDAYKNYIKPFENTTYILKELKNRLYKLALVTSADREMVMGFIKNQKLGKYFQNYVFGTEVKKSKPVPEIYYLALKKAMVSPDSSVVIEDSYNGIKSAKATGAYVIGLANNQAKADLLKAGADSVVLKLKDILLIL